MPKITQAITTPAGTAVKRSLPLWRLYSSVEKQNQTKQLISESDKCYKDSVG